MDGEAARATSLTRDQQVIVQQALPMVNRAAGMLAARYAGVVGHEDLVSHGHEGLVQAAVHFDPGVSPVFEGFAWARVYGAMMDAVRTAATHRRREQVAATEAALAFLEGQRDPADIFNDTVEDDARHFASFVDGVCAAMLTNLVGAALGPADQGEGAVIARQEYARALEVIREALAALPDRERQLVERHALGREEFKRIAGDLGMSYVTARRSYDRALQRLGGA